METLCEAPISRPEAYHRVPPVAPGAGFDARWAAWLERGRLHDRRVRERLVVSGAVLAMAGVGVAIVYALAR
jgi:hypothetical protein